MATGFAGGTRQSCLRLAAGPGTDEWQVQAERVSNGERHMLAQGETGYYVPTGHLVYAQTATGTLVAVPFDLTRPSGPSCRACPRCPWRPVRWGEVPSSGLSGNGMLAYVAGRTDFEDRTLVWVDQQGR